MNPHIVTLCKAHNIQIVTPRTLRNHCSEDEAIFLKASGSCALRRKRSVYLPTEHSNPRRNYIIGLHEIGHILNPLQGWDKGRWNVGRRLKDEQLAWEWAFENARPRMYQIDIYTATDSFLHHATAPFLDRMMELYNEAKQLALMVFLTEDLPNSLEKTVQMQSLTLYSHYLQKEMDKIRDKYIL